MHRRPSRLFGHVLTLYKRFKAPQIEATLGFD